MYREVCPLLAGGIHLAWSPSNLTAAPGETAERYADRLQASNGVGMLAEVGRRQCTAVMRRHAEVLAPLLREDLRNGSLAQRERALRVVDQTNAIGLFDDVVAALRDPDPMYAAQALRTLHDPRAIPLLVARFPDEPTRYFEILRSLQLDRPAHPALLALLHADDAKVRWQAAYALSESGDPALAPLARILTRDPDADVRRQAGRMGLMLHPPARAQIRESLLRLLSDPDVGVRVEIATHMASLQDRAAAPALLELVRLEDTLVNWRQSNVTQAVQTLTGSYFGLQPGTPSPPAVRQKALAAFAQWIRDNP